MDIELRVAYTLPSFHTNMTIHTSQPAHHQHWHLYYKLPCILAVAVALCAITASCRSTADEPETVVSRARIDVDWSGYGKETPTGMTIMFHHKETGEMTHAIDNNTAHITTELTIGHHWATVFNLTIGEFENIGFRGLDTAETAEAYAREYTANKWLTILSDENSYVACQPEWLATDTILTNAVETLPETKIIGTLHPRNVIYTLHIRVDVGNTGSMIAARGAISGMASGRRLAAESPNTNSITATHLINSDSWIRTAESSVCAEMRCFGLPANHQGLPEENIFEFQALLSDGKTVKTYTMPVGHLVKNATASKGDDLDMYLEIRLDPPLPAAGNNGSIDVWLKDWDESIDFNISV